MSIICSILLLFVGLYLLIYLKGLPLRVLGRALKTTLTVNQNGKRAGAFSSLCTNLAATLGIGNIVGVSAAIMTGGPGALFWMNISALAGMAIKFSENILGVRYCKNIVGVKFSGPYLYMEQGLGRAARPLAVLFSMACLLSGVLGMGTITQSNSIALALPQSLRQLTICVGIVDFPVLTVTLSVLLTALTGFVIFGGTKRIADTAQKIIPSMTIVFVLLSCSVLICNLSKIPKAIRLVVNSAFSLRSVGGGLLGTGICRSLVVGIQRGVFSNEAGMGTSAITVSASNDSSSIEQGYAGIASVFVDTIVMCTLTGLTILVTDAWRSNDTAAHIVSEAWQKGLPVYGSIAPVLMFGFLMVFGFTSIIGWNYYAEQSVRYLFSGSWAVKLYQFLYLIAIFLGPFLSAEFSWAIADFTNALMILPNLFAILILRKDIKAECNIINEGRS